MLWTSFRGSDDGFTFTGVIVFLLILLVLAPAISGFLNGRFKENLETLEVREALFEERQAELDAVAEETGRLSESLPGSGL